MKRNITGYLFPTEIAQSGCKVTKDLFDTQIVGGKFIRKSKILPYINTLF